MRSLFSTLIVLALATPVCFGQTFDWAKSAGSNSYDIANGLRTDAAGNTIITGWFRDSCWFGTTPVVSNGGYEYFVAKYDANGNLQWVRTAGGSGNDIGYGVDFGQNGDVYVTGTFRGTVQFGSITLVSNGNNSDIFVAKYDAAGNIQWATNAGGTLDDQGQDLSVDPNGNAYVTGYFKGTALFGASTLVSAGQSDAFLAKYDQNGNLKWARKGSGSNYDNGYGVAATATGAVITGYFRTAATFGTHSLTSAGNEDAYLVRYDTLGNVIWATADGGSQREQGNRVRMDNNDNIYVCGNYEGTAQFGSVTLNATGTWSNAYVAKYNGSGTVQWAKGFGGYNATIGGGVGVTGTGTLYLTGYFKDTITVESNTLVSNGDWDIYVGKYDTNGNLQWITSAGGTGGDNGYAIDADANGYAYVAGVIRNTVTFSSTTLTSAGIADIYVAKIRTVVTGFEDLASNETVNVFPNPTTDRITIQANDIKEGRVTATLYDLSGKQIQQVSRGAGRDIIIDMVNLPAGAFLLVVQGETTTHQLKVIKS